MDAECIANQRDQLLSRREKRWSMNSQRLEEIVALLMTPISNDPRRYFDTDLTALLEEYLTEAGLHALEAGDEADAEAVVAPNYAELALLLQQSAAIYGRKVDFLYQHVVDVSETLHATALYSSAASAAPAEGHPADAAPAPSPRTPRAGARAEQFSRTGPQRDAARAARDGAAPRPHPTLPRVFMELEPRVLGEARPALRDYDGEVIGLLDDFQASLELSHSRMLVEHESAALVDDEQPTLRPISLVELQQAIEAAAPPLLELPSPLSPGSSLELPCSPLRTSTPLPAPGTPHTPDASTAPASTAELMLPPPVKRERKRRHSANNIDIVEGSLKMCVTKELRQYLAEEREFSLPPRWIKGTVNKRRSVISSERRRLRELEPDPPAGEPRRRCDSDSCDCAFESATDRDSAARDPDFLGWSAADVSAATHRAGLKDSESEDDGFFEQSSVGSDTSTRADCAAWQAGVLARAAAREARGGLDVRALAQAVLAALPAPSPAPAPPVHCDHVLRRVAREDAEVSHVLLSTLFLANAGNVHISPGPPLSLNSFSLELRSADERLYSAAAAADEQFLR